LNDVPLSLTSVEFTLLEMLLREAGRVVTREQLTETVLGRKLGPFDRVIDVHVSNIRKKLGPSERGQRIKSVRGSGYLFVARAEAK
jgi:two-component system response regulator CpxR